LISDLRRWVFFSAFHSLFSFFLSGLGYMSHFWPFCIFPRGSGSEALGHTQPVSVPHRPISLSPPPPLTLTLSRTPLNLNTNNKYHALRSLNVILGLNSGHKLREIISYHTIPTNQPTNRPTQRQPLCPLLLLEGICSTHSTGDSWRLWLWGLLTRGYLYHL
jgi:hypothetical protein